MKRLCSMQKDSTASGNLDLQNLTTFYNYPSSVTFREGDR
ncbi:hypothetical protein COO91_03087 [Nostoc flagelliforme CCNUN1]|uniref:Uncharacterized protein n=1 Tax=Nostoc flagelliforme CCNUN1 TaxID=2038116 RepID=A0A2K8SP09_9NOSO|nr:hypothetical protein COO91_03087 [Nostoc flagelliforme CCNUN1]